MVETGTTPSSVQLLFSHRTMRKVANDAKNDTCASRYSILIDNMPEYIIEGHTNYQLLLEKHLLKILNTVRERQQLQPKEAEDAFAEVVLVRDYDRQLLRYNAIVAAKKKLDNARMRKRIEKNDKDVKKLENKLNQLKIQRRTVVTTTITARAVKRAFVMFQELEDRDMVVEHYRLSVYLMTRLSQKEDNRFQSYPIYVGEPPEPGDIMWENQDRVEWKVFCAQILTFVLSMLVMTASFVIIFFSKSQLQLANSNKNDCSAQEDIFSERDAVNNENLHRGLTFCECNALGLATILRNTSLVTRCSSFISSEISLLWTMIGNTVTVIIVNAGLKFTIVALANTERPLSHSALHHSIAIQMFRAQVTNTALIILLINSYYFIIFGLAGTYYDFSREWYKNIGQQIMLIICTQIFVPHTFQLLFSTLLRSVRLKLGAPYCETQEELNEMYTGLDWRLSFRIAQVLTIIFTCCIYSAALPMINFVAAASFIVIFWSDKYILLRLAKRPPQYDMALLASVRSVLPTAVLYHLCFAIWIYGNTDLFPTSSNSNFQYRGDKVFFFDAAGQFFLRSKLQANILNLILFIITISFIAAKLLILVLGKPFITPLKVVIGKRFNIKSIEYVEQQSFLQAAEIAKNRGLLFSYQPEANPEYAHLFREANGGRSTFYDSAKVVADRRRTKRNTGVPEVREDIVVASANPLSAKARKKRQTERSVGRPETDTSAASWDRSSKCDNASALSAFESLNTTAIPESTPEPPEQPSSVNVRIDSSFTTQKPRAKRAPRNTRALSASDDTVGEVSGTNHDKRGKLFRRLLTEDSSAEQTLSGDKKISSSWRKTKTEGSTVGKSDNLTSMDTFIAPPLPVQKTKGKKLRMTAF
eukprot:GEMP01002454.1.p1 GENE.GEMP01002454.1~~GEMP01002454.1.p1  ORF type:complete len:873 (+),score=109.41 GEMP01002454.1:734-3352(+)